MGFHLTLAEGMLILAAVFAIHGIVNMLRHRNDMRRQGHDDWHLAIHERLMADAIDKILNGLLIVSVLLLNVPGYGMTRLGWVGFALAGLVLLWHWMVEHVANRAEARLEAKRQAIS